jgi:hypothetical protein
MGRRSTREETLKAEDQAVRLAARGLNDREIGLALGLSESEARRKRQLGLERRRQEEAVAGAWERVDAELAEALRTAYRDHDDAPPGSAARVGCLKVVIELIARRARLHGIEMERASSASPTTGAAGGDTMGRPAWAEFQGAMREADERLRQEGRAVIELERAAGHENVRPPEQEGAFTGGGKET